MDFGGETSCLKSATNFKYLSNSYWRWNTELKVHHIPEILRKTLVEELKSVFSKAAIISLILHQSPDWLWLQ